MKASPVFIGKDPLYLSARNYVASLQGKIPAT